LHRKQRFWRLTTGGAAQSFFFSFTFTDWVLGSPLVGV